MLSNIDFPWQTYEYLTRVSQIPRDERIRSDSSSRPGQHLGLPVLRPGGGVAGQGACGRCGSVLIEPIFADY